MTIRDRATAERHNDLHWRVVAKFNALMEVLPEGFGGLKAVGLGGEDRDSEDAVLVVSRRGMFYEIPLEEDEDGEICFELAQKREVAAVSYVPVQKAAAAVERARVVTGPKPEKADAGAPPADIFRVETDPKKVSERYRLAGAEAASKAARNAPRPVKPGIYRGSRGTAVVRKQTEEIRGGADPKDPTNPFRVRTKGKGE